MVTLTNFANKDFETQQKWNTRTARLFGGIDKVLAYGPEDIDKDFLNKNARLLDGQKGFGSYFWKPYIINKALTKVADGDYLVYADSGNVFLKNVAPLIEHMKNRKEDILCFKLPLIEKQWTKRDAFVLMNCDSKEFTETRQVTANFFLIKKTGKTERFIEEYQKFCGDFRILSNAPNSQGLPNYPEFIEHRNDQSVLSLLCKKHDILLEDDVSDYGVFPHKYIHKESYIFDEKAMDTSGNGFKGTILSNRKVHPINYIAKYYVRLLLSKMGIKT